MKSERRGRRIENNGVGSYGREEEEESVLGREVEESGPVGSAEGVA